jgi:hypothetical protein
MHTPTKEARIRQVAEVVVKYYLLAGRQKKTLQNNHYTSEEHRKNEDIPDLAPKVSGT